MTLDELRQQYPDLVSQVEEQARAADAPGPDAVSAAVQAEQRRLREIDEVAMYLIKAD